MAGNTNLNNSARDKQDEFYTEIGMIEKHREQFTEQNGDHKDGDHDS